MSKRIGIVPHLFARPLIESAKSGSNGAGQRLFAFETGEYAQLALQLRQGNLDGAFLSPIEYARLNDPFDRRRSESAQSGYAHFRIVPGVCAASEGESGAAVLVFKEHLRDVKNVLIDPRFPSEIVLLRLVLAEKFDSHPQLVPASKISETALKTNDAALLVDRDALQYHEHQNKIDLIDEWSDLTDAQFIHGFWAAGETALSGEEAGGLASTTSPDDLRELPEPEKEYLSNFSYAFDDRAVSGLNEFFRMAYYHGVLQEIPDVRFHDAEGSQPAA
ncbi:MAG TPA: MqnA/MqnD/SBP family protein [Bacteroidota bacterium]|nr:MqnA/MqnD/SBP family protein [Bacteroidota bacterium]